MATNPDEVPVEAVIAARNALADEYISKKLALEKTTIIARLHKKRTEGISHAATQASRSGMALELVSKILLRHADIATTQRYLGKVSVAEASRAIEDLLG